MLEGYSLAAVRRGLLLGCGPVTISICIGLNRSRHATHN